ncbi:hypothetical protein Tco_1038689 [Tanacetum coccineum]
MPTNVKTYDGTGDPEDHLKIFQAAEKIERWAMPTWCHMELLAIKEVHKRPRGDPSYQVKGGRVDKSFHGNIQSRKHACQWGTIVHENIGVHARSPSPYNGIIGRPGIRKIQAVPSTAHGMLKFLVKEGILIIRNNTIIPAECRMVAEAPSEPPPKNQRLYDRRSKVHSGTSLEYPRRMPAHKSKKKGAGTGQKQGNPRGSRQTCRSRNNEMSALSRLARKPGLRVKKARRHSWR